MAKKIVNWRNLSSEQLERVREIAPEYEIVGSLDEIDNLADIAIMYGWESSEKPEKVIQDPKSQLKWVQTASAGIDYLPLEEMEAKGIQLSNSSGIHAHGIAESIFGMLLNHTRAIGPAVLAQEKKEWIREVRFQELNNKTMMIVGTGQIGRQTGKLAKAFGMSTIGINRSGGSVEYMDRQYTQDSLKEVIEQADVVVDILPLTNETAEIFNHELFSKMNEQAIFINVGRGGTVNTDDLVDALEKKEFAFAALDVFHEEPLPAAHPLWQREDVLITPHYSGGLEDYDKSLFPIFEENLKAFVNGEQLPVNLVDYSKGY